MLPTAPVTHGRVLRQVVSHLPAAPIIRALLHSWWIPKQAVPGEDFRRRDPTELGAGGWDSRNENVSFGTPAVIVKQSLWGLNSSQALQLGAASEYNH